MQILITGAAGFIGSNLTEALLTQAHTVVAFDNLSQGTLLNLESVQNHRRFRFVEGDVREKKALQRAAKGCDVIVHLAAYKIPRYSDATETLLTNSQGTLNVLEAAAPIKAKVVAASTSDVYGKNPAVPFSEESDLVIGRPEVKRWAYAISKMFEEQLLFAYHEKHGLDVVALRFFGGYGPNQHLTWWGGPQSVFINAALDDEPMSLHGDGMQTRSFTYISDHVSGIVATIEKERANNLVFNLGNTREIAIRDLALMIWRTIRADEPKLQITPYETFGKYEDVMRRVPDISRARSLLGFEPRVHLEEGLKPTIRWQVERRRRLGIATPHFDLPFGEEHP